MKHINFVYLLLIFISTSVFSEENDEKGFYIGGMIGKSNTEEIYNEGSDLEVTIEGEQGAFGVYGGYNYNMNWAVEMTGYFMKLEDERVTLANIDESYLTIFTIAPKYQFALSEQIGIFVKVGIGVLVYIEEYDDDVGFWDFEDSDTWYGVGVNAAIGLEFDVSPNVEFRVGYEIVEAEMEADDDNQRFSERDIEEKFSIVYLGMNYRF